MLEVVASRYDGLAGDRRAQLEALCAAEFGGLAGVRETVGATPDSAYLGLVGGELACFHGLVLRAARFDGEPVAVAGVSNLVTLPAFRGRGLASRLQILQDRP